MLRCPSTVRHGRLRNRYCKTKNVRYSLLMRANLTNQKMFIKCFFMAIRTDALIVPFVRLLGNYRLVYRLSPPEEHRHKKLGNFSAAIQSN